MNRAYLLLIIMLGYGHLFGQYPRVCFNAVKDTMIINIKNRTAPANCNDSIRWYFPVYRAGVAKNFYKKAFNSNPTSYLDNIVIQGNLDRGIAYSELVSGNIGVFRVSFGAMISAQNNQSVRDEALQKLIGAGGNTVLNIYYPFIYKKTKYLDVYWQLATKFSGDIPALGSLTNEVTGNINLGSELYLDLTSENKAISFFAYVRGSYITGSTEFYENLDIDSKGFLYGQLNFGITLNVNTRISFTIPLFSSQSSLLDFPVIMGTQVLPTFDN